MKHAKPDHPIHEQLAARWSPYGFEPKTVSGADLRSLLEAARWAPSSYNEQPWRFLVAKRENEAAFQKALGCLVEANQAWAKNSSVLLLACVSERFSRNDKPNAAAEHDLGLAASNLSLEATARGLSVHQMIGIDAEAVREAYSVPEGVKPLTAIAIGYAAKAEDLEGTFKERDLTARERKSQAEFVFADKFGEAF